MCFVNTKTVSDITRKNSFKNPPTSLIQMWIDKSSCLPLVQFWLLSLYLFVCRQYFIHWEAFIRRQFCWRRLSWIHTSLSIKSPKFIPSLKLVISDQHIIFICSKLLPPINISTNIIHKKIHGNLCCNFYAWLTFCIQCSREDVICEIKFKIQYILLDKNHWTMDWGYLCYHDCPELCFPINR